MVDGAPEIAELAVDPHECLIHMPPPLNIAAHVRDAPLANLGGEHWTKPVPPEPDGLIADVDPALGQEILDVAQRQRESHVHHHDQTDDLWRAVEISERAAHGMKLPRSEAPRALGLTKPSGRADYLRRLSPTASRSSPSHSQRRSSTDDEHVVIKVDVLPRCYHELKVRRDSKL